MFTPATFCLSLAAIVAASMGHWPLAIGLACLYPLACSVAWAWRRSVAHRANVRGLIYVVEVPTAAGVVIGYRGRVVARCASMTEAARRLHEENQRDLNPVRQRYYVLSIVPSTALHPQGVPYASR